MDGPDKFFVSSRDGGSNRSKLIVVFESGVASSLHLSLPTATTPLILKTILSLLGCIFITLRGYAKVASSSDIDYSPLFKPS